MLERGTLYDHIPQSLTLCCSARTEEGVSQAAASSVHHCVLHVKTQWLGGRGSTRFFWLLGAKGSNPSLAFLGESNGATSLQAACSLFFLEGSIR